MFSFSVQASFLVTNTQNFVTSLGNYVVQRDASIGSVIAKLDIYPRVTLTRSCGSATSSDPWQWQINPKLEATGNYIGNFGNIRTYSTNISGVGIQFFGWDYLNGATIYPNGPGVSFNGNAVGGYIQLYIGVTLVKVGPITSSPIAGQNLAAYSLSDSVCGDSLFVGNLSIASTGSVTETACSSNNSNLNIDFGTISANEFSGIGNSPRSSNVNLQLTCNSQARINMSLKGIQNTDTQDTSILALSNSGDPSVAKGIGVQFLYNNMPLHINDNMVLKTSSGGQESFPLEVHYYQTLPNVTAGSANATATLSMIYQ
jgi:type 1 fimbria pilin